jgi:outer membrane protein
MDIDKKESTFMNSRLDKNGSRMRSGGVMLCIMFLLTNTAPTIAQPITQRWTLVQCLERALEVNFDIHIAQTDIEIATGQLEQAKAGRLPHVSATGLTGLVNGTEGEGFDARSDNSDIGPFLKGEIEIVQPLYTFGRLRNEIRAGTQGVAAQQAASEQARDAVIVTIKELYYNLLLSRQIKDLLAEVQENFTKALQTAEERLANQEANITQQDVLKLRIGLAGVTKEVFTLERAIAVTHHALQQQLGLSFSESFDITDTRLEPVQLNLQPVATYIEQAAQHRPELARLQAGLEARQARLQAAQSAYYPSFFLAGGIRGAIAPNRENQKSPFAKDEFNYFSAGMALGMRWKLDFWMTQAKVAERAAELAKTDTQKRQAVTGIHLDVQRRYLEIKEQQQKLQVARKARKTARALMVTSLANFTLGIGEAKEVFNNLGLYTRMAGDYYKVIYDFNLSAAKLSQAVGQEITTLSYQR